MAFEKMPVIPGDIITSAWGNHIQTQYDEAKADLAAHLADDMPHLFVVGGTTYRWGLKVVNGVVTMVYEEVV